MELNEIRGGRLDVITEESRESSDMEPYPVVSDRGTRTFQRFSVNTNESLHFDPCENNSPSPTGAEDGLDDDDDVFKRGDNVVRMPTQLKLMNQRFDVLDLNNRILVKIVKIGGKDTNSINA